MNDWIETLIKITYEPEKSQLRFSIVFAYGGVEPATDYIEELLRRITGPVRASAWAMAIVGACNEGKPIKLKFLAARILLCEEKLEGENRFSRTKVMKCSCGHLCVASFMVTTPSGSSCPDCAERMMKP
jgi:hypothetical protein